MHPKQILALASLFTTMVSSAPTITTPELVERQDSSPYFLTPLETRAVSAVEERGVVDKRGITIVLFGGDNCTGQQHSIVQDTGSLCYAVPAAKRSLHGVGKYVLYLLYDESPLSPSPYK